MWFEIFFFSNIYIYIYIYIYIGVVFSLFCPRFFGGLGNKNPLCPWVSWVDIGLIDYKNKVCQRLIVNICVEIIPGLLL